MLRFLKSSWVHLKSRRLTTHSTFITMLTFSNLILLHKMHFWFSECKYFHCYHTELCKSYAICFHIRRNWMLVCSSYQLGLIMKMSGQSLSIIWQRDTSHSILYTDPSLLCPWFYFCIYPSVPPNFLMPFKRMKYVMACPFCCLYHKQLD